MYVSYWVMNGSRFHKPMTPNDILNVLSIWLKWLNIFILDGCNTNLTKAVLTSAYDKTVPLSLHNAKLFKENKIDFSFVGGLKEAKQIIIETIIWPSLVSLICVFNWIIILVIHFFG